MSSENGAAREGTRRFPIHTKNQDGLRFLRAMKPTRPSPPSSMA